MHDTSPAPILREDGFVDRGSHVTRFQAFLDASFAFTVTLLVIAGNEVPDSVPKLIAALKSVPTFAASFLLIVLFWSGHDTWTRRYGLDDGRARGLGLLLIFLVLVYVYPLKMLFGSFFSWITEGALPAKFTINTVDDLRMMFYMYALAFGTLGAVMALLYRHAWRLREQIGLFPAEQAATRDEMRRWTMLPAFSALSASIAWLLPEKPPVWLTGLPGIVYFVLHAYMVLWRRRQRRLAASPIPEAQEPARSSGH